MKKILTTVALIISQPSLVFANQPKNWQLGFQDPATPIMEGIIGLHNDVMGIIVFITVFVCWMLARTLYLFDARKNATP